MLMSCQEDYEGIRDGCWEEQGSRARTEISPSFHFRNGGGPLVEARDLECGARAGTEGRCASADRAGWDRKRNDEVVLSTQRREDGSRVKRTPIRAL